MAQAMDLIDRLVRSTNDHDLDALVECFAPDYLNETPVHPERGFRGRDQVRLNWETIFGFVPDVRATVVRAAVDAETVWTEWEMRGTRPDGSDHLMRGVIIFGVDVGIGVITWARFFLEPADEGATDVNEALRQQIGAP